MKHLNFTIDLQQWRLPSLNTEIFTARPIAWFMCNSHEKAYIQYYNIWKGLPKKEKKVVNYQGWFYKCEKMGVDSFMMSDMMYYRTCNPQALVVVTSESQTAMIALIVGMIILTSPSNSFGRTDVNLINYFQ